jgi:hypothetical protein
MSADRRGKMSATQDAPIACRVMAERSSSSIIPEGLLKKKWLSTIVSLLVGLGLGTTFGREVLDSAGIPASCVRTIQRADRAIETGTAVADDGKAAFQAVKDLEISTAADFLRDAKNGADALVELVQLFNEARTTCNADRK